jgi:Domain of unknown function (DUF4340)
MKSTGLLIAAAFLAALTGTLYWSDHHKAADPTAAAVDAAPKILTLKDADLSKIDVKKKGAGELALVKTGAGKWQITAPAPFAADQDAVSSMVSTLSSLNSERLVEDKASDLKQYGLTDPALEVDIATKDGKSQKLLLGDNTPAGNAVFAAISGDPRVFTIASYTKTSIDKSPNDLRDKRLLTADFDKISQVELTSKKQSIAFGRNKDSWQILKPRPLRADNFAVEDLVRKLKDAKMDLAAATDTDEKKSAAAFASDAPIAIAKVTDAAGTQELQIRKDKDAYYAKSSAVPGIYKVTNDLGTGLDKNLDDFRNKKLFDFGFDEPNKVELHDGPRAYFLTKGGADWWSNGKKMDDSSVQSLIDKVRDLSSNKFLDSGFTTPLIDLTVSSNDGKRTEKVEISKSGDTYIAKRENEPSLYQLDSKPVEELQKSAANVKPAPEPQPSATGKAGPATKK